MSRPRLRFYCKGTALITDPHAQDRGLRRFVGRAWRQIAPPIGVGPNAHPGTWVWAPTGEVEEIDFHFDLLQACRDGELWAADEATAKTCGVPFDPEFGDEKFQTIRDFKAGHPGLTIRERRAAVEAEAVAEKAAAEAAQKAHAEIVAAEAAAKDAAARAAAEKKSNDAPPVVEGTPAEAADDATADHFGGKDDD